MDILSEVIETAYDAGDAIMKIYAEGDFGVEMKEDNSPLTLADRAAHKIIVERLAETGIPILSEESDEVVPYETRKEWKQLWIVDPLDGTKEFIKRNGEFTVNIALVENGVPVLGVVYAPALDKLYFSVVGDGAYVIDGTQSETEAIRLPSVELPEKFTIVGSRSHSSPETEAYIEEMKAKHGEVDFAASGSSLKFCLVAEGKAHSYPRFAPTMEWDTAAGHAVLLGAGGSVVVWPEKTELRYNREQLRNPWFLATLQ
jgi:3'(2'), 5'-bisphosphate nucleotidase